MQWLLKNSFRKVEQIKRKTKKLNISELSDFVTGLYY